MGDIFSARTPSASRSWSTSCGGATIRCRSTSSRPRCPERSPSSPPAGATAPCWTGPTSSGRSSPCRGRVAAGARLRRCCERRGIRVLSAAPAFAAAVAEMALALALASQPRPRGGGSGDAGRAERFLSNADDARHLSPARQAGRLRRLREHRSAAPPAARALRLRALRYDPWLTDAFLRDEGVEPTALVELLETSRVRLRARVPDERERSAPLARAAGARAGRCRARPRQPGARGRLRRADRARARGPLPSGDRRLSVGAARCRATRSAARRAPCSRRTAPG